MSAHVDVVKSAAARVVASEADALCNEGYSRAEGVRLMTQYVFSSLYGRNYDSRTDRTEYARIKWHVRRILNGDTGPGRGGAREGAGRPAKEQAK